MMYRMNQSLAIGLAVSRSSWPPRPTLLVNGNSLDFVTNKSRDCWSIDEWRRYAEFIENAGKNLSQQLNKLQEELLVKSNKLRRGKSKGASSYTLLSDRPVVKRGRPRGSKSEQYAIEALELKKSCDRSMNDEKAILDVLTNLHRMSFHKAKPQVKTIKRLMTKLRKHSK